MKNLMVSLSIFFFIEFIVSRCAAILNFLLKFLLLFLFLLFTYSDHNSSKNFLRNDRDRRPGGDLTVRKGANRRVSFKTQSRQNNAKLRNVELGLRNVMEEDDEMIERRRRRGSPIPKSARGGKGQPKLIESTSGWFQVTVSFKKSFCSKMCLLIF